MNSFVLNSMNTNNLVQIPGLKFNIYMGYFNDDVNWFNTSSVYPGTVVGYATDFTNLRASINNQLLSIDNVSVQWYGKIVTPPGTDGTWTFTTSSDDASFLWIGPNADIGYTTSNAVVNNGGTHRGRRVSGNINLISNTVYSIRIQYGDVGGGESLSVFFTKPGGTETILIIGSLDMYSYGYL